VSAISLAGRAHGIDASQAAIPLLATGPEPAIEPSRSTRRSRLTGQTHDMTGVLHRITGQQLAQLPASPGNPV
jgi:hypothetical protein